MDDTLTLSSVDEKKKDCHGQDLQENTEAYTH